MGSPPHESNLCGGCRAAGRCRLGLRIWEISNEGVVARGVCPATWTGGPSIAHGGWTAAAFDDVVGRTVRATGTRSVTAHLAVDFVLPVPVENELLIRARVTGARAAAASSRQSSSSPTRVRCWPGPTPPWSSSTTVTTTDTAPAWTSGLQANEEKHQMHVDLTGSRIIVTGGARGIGESLVRVLCAEGALVAVLDVLDDAGQAVAGSATAAGPGRAVYHSCDVTSRSAVTEVFAAVAADFGGLDSLVHGAGVETRAPAEEITDASGAT